MIGKRVYLASPYTHPHPYIRAHRALLAEEVTADLLRQGVLVFSPIVHNHTLSVRYNLPGNFDFWQRHNECFLRHWAEALAVLLLPGVSCSTGVRAEIIVARELGFPITVVKLARERRKEWRNWLASSDLPQANASPELFTTKFEKYIL